MGQDFVKTDEFLNTLESEKDRVWIFLDTETLGFNANKHQLTEVAAKATKINNNKFEELCYYHEKSKLLSITRRRLDYPYRCKGMSYRDIMKMTNYGEPIKNRQYVEEKQILQDFLSFINRFEDPILVAHNASFDIGFLNKRYNVYYENKNPFDDYEVVDTLKIMKKYFAPLIATESRRFNHRWLSAEERQHITITRKIRSQLQKKKTKKLSLKLGEVANSLDLSSEGWHTAKNDVEILISTIHKITELFICSAGRELYSEKHLL